jgi:hypothetical protein
MMVMMVMMTCSRENCVQTYCMKRQLRGFRYVMLQGVVDLLLRSVNGMGGCFKIEWKWKCMLLVFEWGMACQKLSSIVCSGSHSKCQPVLWIKRLDVHCLIGGVDIGEALRAIWLLARCTETLFQLRRIAFQLWVPLLRVREEGFEMTAWRMIVPIEYFFGGGDFPLTMYLKTLRYFSKLGHDHFLLQCFQFIKVKQSR